MAIGRLPIDETNVSGRQLVARTARSAIGSSVGVQTEEILELIDSDLLAAKAHRSDIKLATFWLRDLSQFPQINRIWEEWIEGASLTRGLTLEDHDLPRLCDVRIRVTLHPK